MNDPTALSRVVHRGWHLYHGDPSAHFVDPSKSTDGCGAVLGAQDADPIVTRMETERGMVRVALCEECRRSVLASAKREAAEAAKRRAER